MGPGARTLPEPGEESPISWPEAAPVACGQCDPISVFSVSYYEPEKSGPAASPAPWCPEQKLMDSAVIS